MRARVALFLGLISFTTSLFAIDRWILISGTTGNFHTDARLFNPSFDKDITINATFYPLGGGSPQTASVTVPKRQMKVLDDVTTQLFSTSNLGAILFTSGDAFEATSRIYAQTAAGTLGQFGPGTDPGAAKKKGVLLQLKANGTGGQTGTFRTNIGMVNPNNTTANVTWVIYDKNNAIIATATAAYPPTSALGPTPLTGLFTPNAVGDFSDAWLAYSSDQPILAYASVVDNGTTDQTFVPAVEDVGVPPVTPTGKEFTVTMKSFQITVDPPMSNLRQGDKVTLHIKVIEGAHQFEMVGPTGSVVVPLTTPTPGGATIDQTFTVNGQGTYTYFCMNMLCGAGHSAMVGSFSVGRENPDPPGY